MMPQIKENVSLAPFTTYKIGGPAKYFSSAKTKEELIELVKWAKKNKLPVFVLGGGSNLLVSDKGFDGLVLKLQITACALQNDKIIAEAGLPLARVVFEAAKNGLAGFEWAAGIPGTVGGAVYGNAGAFGKYISDVIDRVEFLDTGTFTVGNMNAQEARFDYKDSVFKKNGDFIILSAVFKLEKGDPEDINCRIREIIKKRSCVDGGGARSAGCVFKNINWSRQDINKELILKKFPELKRFSQLSGISVGFLIDQLGLKGKIIGGAAIYDKHANYFINLGNATAEDVIMLMGFVKEKIHQKYGFLLEEEIQYVGFDPVRSSAEL